MNYLAGARVIGLTAAEAKEDARAFGARVSPWLWVLSLGGFAMALANRYQIGQMYGSWRKMRQAVRRGET